jgi:polysaccharide export outer membrane protein
MNANKRVSVLALAVVFSLSGSVVLGQTQTSDAQKTRKRTTTEQNRVDTKVDNSLPAKVEGGAVEQPQPEQSPEAVKAPVPDKTSPNVSDIPPETQAKRREQVSEEAAIEPFYNNFFTTYRLGPEDVISVTVFGQERYSRAGIAIPPSGRISLSLIPGGVFVNGKTVEEVAEIITKRYDEFIIDPQVTVSLDKASSYRYSIIGDVGQPGIRMMTHRMTVTEALAEAGGVLSTGNKSGVTVLRRQPNGHLAKIPVNVSKIYKGELPDTTYLVPGDQIMVPGNKLKTLQTIMGMTPILSFARIFTGGPLPF